MAVQLTIVGLGQIGTSVGLALADQTELVYRRGHDREHSAARRAGIRPDAAVGDRVAIDTKEASSNPGVAFFRTQGWLSYSGRSDDLLMKTIVGVGSDEVTEEDGRLYVNGQPLARSASRRQRAVGTLPLPSVELPQRIKEGEVWLSSDHERGIDSRYFGAVARSSIACKVEAAWTL